jgi:hypothetical protein
MPDKKSIIGKRRLHIGKLTDCITKREGMFDIQVIEGNAH